MTVVKDRPRHKALPRQRLVGRWVACVLLVLTAWGVLFTLTSPVSTDVPVLTSTTPAAGSTSRPDHLVLTFDRPVEPGLATIRLTDPYRRPVDPGRPTRVAGREETLSVPLPKQKYAGTYAVAWHVPAGLGAASGTFTFDLASRSPAWPAPEIRGTRGAPLAYALAEFGGLAVCALLAGVAFRTAVTGVPMARTARIAWFGAVGCVLAALLTFGPAAAKLPLADAFSLLPGTAAAGVGPTFLARLALLALTALPLVQLMTVGPPADGRERWLRAGTVVGVAAALVATWGFHVHY